MENNNEKTLTLGIGSILVCSWGYSMTLVDFYKVIKETAKTVLVQAIGSKEISDTMGYLSGHAIPDENKILEEQLRVYKKYHDNGCSLKSRKRGFAKYFSKWDGEPQYFNHCD